MNNHFTKKYGGSAGRILDAWGENPINREIGDIYEESVFGQASINMKELLQEYYSETTGGAINYGGDLKSAVNNSKIMKG